MSENVVGWVVVEIDQPRKGSIKIIIGQVGGGHTSAGAQNPLIRSSVRRVKAEDRGMKRKADKVSRLSADRH